ncbi:DUF2007 domain-containing protein [Alteromonas sp. ASW11-36]|uniref:DUF2007 domain-containing protein n=1 Tax=Alteromonas arenosi TaxID=3055817 RepID=A0ABT7SVD3_9ALTE|nr:DUF2007 domain-containing protein [Alteromonas sp. ASW11-36]MDM7859502.1 DUF2007 domain-containing protein [Alteromonas sp. ASW11-36]
MLIYSDFERFRVYQIKQLLDDHGIPCYVKNEFASGAVGELAPQDVQPEIWLQDAQWQVKAKRVIDDYIAQNQASQNAQDWRCNNCQEENEGSFVICWNCQTSRPES